MSDSRITISVAPPRSVAGIGAFADRAALLTKMQEEFGIELPVTSGCVQSSGVSISCLAPGRFLASGARNTRLPASDWPKAWLGWRRLPTRATCGRFLLCRALLCAKCLPRSCRSTSELRSFARAM